MQRETVVGGAVGGAAGEADDGGGGGGKDVVGGGGKDVGALGDASESQLLLCQTGPVNCGPKPRLPPSEPYEPQPPHRH